MMARLHEYTPAEEAEHEAQESMRDALLAVCTHANGDGPCRMCVPCLWMIADWDDAAEAHVEARAEAYAEARAM